LYTTDTLHFKVSFKNISNTGFDSLKVKLTITDNDGNNFSYNPVGMTGTKMPPLNTGDSVILSYNIPAANYSGTNQLLLDVNPANAQPEQFHFNNLLYRNFWVISPLCPGANISYSSGYRGVGYTYQWQVNSGSGFTNLSNNAVYSNAQGDTLKLTAPPTSWYGNQYRCMITEGINTYFSGEYVLKFGVKWTGAVNTAWENTGNWSCGSLPDQYTDVTIPGSVSNYPRVNTSVSCRSVAVAAGASVIVTAGNNLTILK
jgi:hypothetical protein